MLKSVAAIAFAALSLPAFADEAGDITRRHLYEGDLAQGVVELTPYWERFESEGSFGLGVTLLAQGIERFSQALYRYGFSALDNGPTAPTPLMMPVPPNPHPEPIDYPKVRAMLSALVEDMDKAKERLLDAGKVGDYVVPIDILKLRIDIDGDGVSSEKESIGAFVAATMGAAGALTGSGEGAPTEIVVGFDRADAIWLAGYTQIIAAQADFLLAHDFHEIVDVAFHRLFPQGGLPMQGYTHGTNRILLDADSDQAIADLVAAIHTMNWPVTEPARLKRVLTRFKEVTALSRQNWDAILAETDDNRELLPSPKQTSIIPDATTTDDTVAAWMATLDAVDLILDGQLLIPHWRFTQGFDLKAYFENATRTDPVMLITGYDALPFLKPGPIANDATFREGTRVFGDQWLGYAFWHN